MYKVVSILVVQGDKIKCSGGGAEQTKNNITKNNTPRELSVNRTSLSVDTTEFMAQLQRL
ncbi:hypothetical protein PT279_07985 [Bifidobacterium sp. ESL0784]|uniref:hypothetical protein n=1 Tax=Bifidobacterium sp. ESL0784 TaxID=2983231 RepID=UPI0023F94747|nr:hypothetical protein [Bifidobacterium sp. ESL0784]MDF7641523.1 hypothetical protein [Bifidobacterium sp. ESL0784]